MATVAALREGGNEKYVTHTWETLTSGDDGAAVRTSELADKTVQVFGTFAGETVTMQGSMDSTNWFTLTDGAGVDVTFTATGGSLIAENPRYIRPLGDGSGTTVDVDVILGASSLF